MTLGLLCNICGGALGRHIFEARSRRSLTSLCTLRDGRVRVWHCDACGHLQGEPLADERHYYETEYRILLNDVEEDQIYEIADGTPVYRADHQTRTLLEKLSLPNNATLLDYGCAKGTMASRLRSHRPDLNVCLFDISPLYRDHWQSVVSDDCQAVGDAPLEWTQKFDFVTTFFALEHVAAPVATVRKMAALLTDRGTLYGIVPDVFGNVADLVVCDHVNHFTASSLHRLLAGAGFASISIDDKAHRGALVFLASRYGKRATPPDLDAVAARARFLASHWKRVDDRIHSVEKSLRGKPFAIYGAGFYGSYVLNAMDDVGGVRVVLDASPFRQGESLFGIPIIRPELLPRDVCDVVIALNPATARQAVDGMSWLKSRGIRPIFLDGDAT